MLAAIQGDKYAIGICNLTDVISTHTQNMVEHVKLLPIDKNGNGKIDYIENIYGDQDELMRGAWVGKHPVSLVNRIYTVAKMKPSTDVDLAFLKWIISDGQEKLSMSGYGDLSLNERLTKMNVLETPELELSTSSILYAYSNRAIVIFSSFVVILVIGIALIRRYRSKKHTETQANAVPEFVFDDNKLIAPGGIFYGKSHTWAFMEKDGIVKIGIDDFLQHITGPITAIKLKNEGEKVSRGDYVLSIVQQGKQINLYSPVSGTIEKQNTALNKDPSMINDSPYSEGWVYRIKPANWLWDIQSLLFSSAYRDWIKGEYSRLKDFLAAFVKPQNLAYEQIVLQDGGEMKDHILSQLGPEAWEDFQENFIDTSK